MNYEIIKRKINFVRKAIIEAKEYLSNYEKHNDRRDQLSLERLAEEIVEMSIKINKELLKEKNNFPITYKESFEKLKILNIFEKEFLEELSNSARFRNELAHEYMGMSNFYSINNIKKIIKIYPKYLLKIYEYVETIENTQT